MPLYLVRWQDLSAALVNAEDEDHLIDVLDEVANVEGARWTEYDGPLFLDFQLPVEFEIKRQTPGRPLASGDIVIGDVKKFLDERQLRVSVAGETGCEMIDEIVAFAFPHLQRLWSDWDEAKEGAVKEALRQDLEVLVQTHWRLEQVKRSADPTDKIAAMLDMPRRLVEQHVERARKKKATPRTPPSGSRKDPRGKRPRK